jgi:hypothetical protein
MRALDAVIGFAPTPPDLGGIGQLTWQIQHDRCRVALSLITRRNALDISNLMQRLVGLAQMYHGIMILSLTNIIESLRVIILSVWNVVKADFGVANVVGDASQFLRSVLALHLLIPTRNY